jgi:hypothetical protein
MVDFPMAIYQRVSTNSGVKYSHTHIIDCLDYQQNYGDLII